MVKPATICVKPAARALLNAAALPPPGTGLDEAV
jgi:hypothetical protein